MQCLCVHKGTLVAGGTFTSAPSAPPVQGAGWWTGSRWESVGSGVDGAVHALASYDGKVVIAGEFTLTGGAVIGHVAVWLE